ASSAFYLHHGRLFPETPASIGPERFPDEQPVIFGEQLLLLSILPAEGCCINHSQARLVIYRDDDNYIKLVHFPIESTRQVEYAKESGPAAAGFSRYGNGVVCPPGDWTWLRIVRRQQDASEIYIAYSSRDGVK
ncbi:MAG: hypothetical protein HY508_11455, partial [Acidobacteria bacterium]|nr:hypothetical protein [Acidobacteriota bacterium]